MPVWLTALRFFAIKNTVAFFLVNPISKRLIQVCRPCPRWLPFCQKITDKCFSFGNKIPAFTIQTQYQEINAETFASKLIAGTCISTSVGLILTITHLKNKKKKKKVEKNSKEIKK